ncbi:MAG TPA: ABC transporter permease subunit [Bacteroidota bacterium]|nr:ABC transporter permease subunit [Bacteroidota bacterium]
MDLTTIYHIARAELVITIRNRWTVIFALVFGGLVVSIAYFGIIAEGFSGLQSFTRTSASLLNLVLYVVPLVSLTMGTLSFTGDKGAAELLFSQPLTRSEVILGKLLGLFFSISLSTLIGFTLAGGIIMVGNGPEGVVPYALFVLLSLALSLVFLGIAVLVATVNRRKSRAFGVALFLWFFFVLFYDLIALGGTLFFRGSSANVFLFVSLFGNPVDMVRVATLILLDNITIFGAAGAVMLRFLGGQTSSVALLVVGLAVWATLPVIVANRLMRRQDL